MVYRFWKPDGRISSYDSIWNWAFAVPLKISSIFLVFELPGPRYHWKVLVERLLTASGPWGSNRRIKWYASLRIWTCLGHWKNSNLRLVFRSPWPVHHWKPLVGRFLTLSGPRGSDGPIERCDFLQNQSICGLPRNTYISWIFKLTRPIYHCDLLTKRFLMGTRISKIWWPDLKSWIF